MVQKKSGNHIGELKQVVVPYTLCLLNIITHEKIDLYKIWKNQGISTSLADLIYDLMKQVNEFILNNSPVSHYIEWAKKEECWLKVKDYKWSYNINDILADCIDENNPPKRNHRNDTENIDEIRQHRESIVKSIPSALWKKIYEWGRDTGMLSIRYASLASDIANKIKFNRKFLDSDIQKGYAIYEIVWEKILNF